MIVSWRAGDRAPTAGLIRAGLLCAVLLGAMAGCVSCATAPDAGPSGPARNLLLITVDTLRADHLSACGHPDLLTPHIDALSRRGALIPDVVTPANTTLPAHASLLTSLPPEGHGGFGNGMAIRHDLPTLARACKEEGMTTAAMVSSWVVGSGWNLEQGFDEYVPLHKTERRRDPSNPGRYLPLRAADTTGAASRWLRRNAGQRFMLWIHYMDPHQEYDPPPPFAAPSTQGTGHVRTPEQFVDLHQRQVSLPPETAMAVRADYAGEVRYTDRCIGGIFHLLRVLGLEKNTLVVVSADHGEALGEKDCYYGHTLSLVEQVNRVPLILAGPGVKTGILEQPATLLDAAPTILTLLGIAPLDGGQGRDLSPLLRAPDAAYGTTGPIPPPLLFTRGENGRRAWLVEGMKATFDPEGRITALYDLEDDPLESNDLLNEQPGLAEDLARRYAIPHTARAAMAADWAGGEQEEVDAETARQLKKLGYVKE